MNEVADDWNTSSFTNIYATNEPSCGGGDAEEVYSRTYGGTALGCDCLGIYS